jgi:very-short-patch-repair endonuclease
VSTAEDRKPLQVALRRQELVLSRAQALAFGITSDALKYRARAGGPWQRLLPGIYLTVTGTPTIRQLEIAALLYAGRDSVLTGLAALRHHGMQMPQPEVATVLIPGGHVRRSRAFVKVVPTSRMPVPVHFNGAVSFAPPARAVADAARELHGFREARALVADAVQQRYCRIEHLQEELTHGPVRGSAWLRRALAEVTGGIRSGAEGDFGDLLRRSGLPMPMFNARLYVGKTFIAVADAWWAEAGVAAEVDSRAWHLSPDDWERTMQRHARLSAQGIIVVHFSPGQIRTEPARVVADIKAALAAGRARPRLAVRALDAGAGARAGQAGQKRAVGLGWRSGGVGLA